MQPSNEATRHGVCLAIFDLGVLLIGDSGIGKSEIALSLVDRGHQLIADDAVTIKRNAEGEVMTSCPGVLQDFLEVRGLGILNVRKMFGDSAICRQKSLSLIVRLERFSATDLPHIDRLHGLHHEEDVLGVTLPQVTIPLAPGRNMAILTEAAVRKYKIREAGYYTEQVFTARQRAELAKKDQ